MKHPAGETVRFYNETCDKVRFIDHTFEPGETIMVTLAKDWDDDDGLGEGGPWGWGAYTSEFVRSIAASIELSPLR